MAVVRERFQGWAACCAGGNKPVDCFGGGCLYVSRCAQPKRLCESLIRISKITLLLLLTVSVRSATLEVFPHDPTSLKKAFADAQNGDEILIQPGRYTIKPAHPAGNWGAPLQLIGKTNITVRAAGDGVEIFGEGAGEFIILAGCSSITFDKISFRSNRAPIQPANWLYSVIMLYGQNEKLSFERCRFLSFGDHAISQLYGIKETTDVVIRNCYFADGGDRIVGDGAAVSGISSGWLVESNLVERCLIGFEIEGPWGSCHGAIIRKNTIIKPTGAGIVIFATSGKSSDFTDIEISDNLIKDGLQDSPQAALPLGILLGGGERIQVLRNTIDNCAYSGIVGNANWADLRDVVIEGNAVTNAGFYGIQLYEFSTNQVSNALIRSNTVSGARLSGVLTAGRNVRILGNTIVNCASAGRFAGIDIENAGWSEGVPRGQTENVEIEDNFIGNQNTDFQDYGIWVRPGVGTVRIAANRFKGNAQGSILDEGIKTVVETCIVGTSKPSLEFGSTVSIFGPPRGRGIIQASADLNEWFNVDSYMINANCEASVVVPGDMILVGRRFYRMQTTSTQGNALVEQ